MKLRLVLRNKKNALKLSTKTIEGFIERIKTDTKDRSVGRRRFLSVELTGPIDVSTPPNYEQLYAQAMRALHQHESYYFGPAETQHIMEWNRRFSVKSSADLLFLDYFEPAIDEQDGKWMSASAIFSYLKEKVGVSLLKPTGISAFGRKLTNLPGLRKRETKYNKEYLVRQKKR